MGKCDEDGKHALAALKVIRENRSTHCLNDGWRFHLGFIPSSTPHLANDAAWREVGFVATKLVIDHNDYPAHIIERESTRRITP